MFIGPDHDDGRSYDSYLVYNRTATEAVLTGNTLQGKARPLHGNGRVE
jgi:hypothetical protein